MTNLSQPPKDFRIFIDYDSEVRKYYVTETEFEGLILEDSDPGRLVSRLLGAARDLLEVTARHDWNQFGLEPGQQPRLVPVFNSPVPISTR